MGAYTGVILLCRTLLAHVVMDKGAKVGLKFVQYVDYLDDHHLAGADSKS